MSAFGRGSTIIVEQEIYSKTPFGNESLFSPATVNITITDPKGVVKVNSEAMTQSVTGKFYYTCQTLDTWELGTYIGTLDLVDTTNTLKESFPVFILK